MEGHKPWVATDHQATDYEGPQTAKSHKPWNATNHVRPRTPGLRYVGTMIYSVDCWSCWGGQTCQNPCQLLRRTRGRRHDVSRTWYADRERSCCTHDLSGHSTWRSQCAFPNLPQTSQDDVIITQQPRRRLLYIRYAIGPNRVFETAEDRPTAKRRLNEQ